MDNNNIENQLDLFNDEFSNENESNEEVVIVPKTGLVERVEKVFVMQDGRQLLSEYKQGRL